MGSSCLADPTTSSMGIASASTPTGTSYPIAARASGFGAHGGRIGTLKPSQANSIVGNHRHGVLIGDSPRDVGVSAEVLYNTIFDNAMLDLDLAPAGQINWTSRPPGPNRFTPCPAIRYVSRTRVAGAGCHRCDILLFIVGWPNHPGHGGASGLRRLRPREHRPWRT